MRFIKKWSYKCAKKFASELKESHQKKSIYYYGFQIAFGAVVKGVLLVTISMLLKVLIPTLVCTLAFVLLRLSAGGCHMDTFGKCIIVSLVQFVAGGMIVKYTYTCCSTEFLIGVTAISFLLGLYAIIRYAPKDSPNKPITTPIRRKKLKRLSLVYLIIWFAIAITLTLLNKNIYAIASCMGILLEVFTLSPTGHKLYNWIKEGDK